MNGHRAVTTNPNEIEAAIGRAAHAKAMAMADRNSTAKLALEDISILISAASARGVADGWPDIGPDPFQQPNEYRTVEKAHARLRAAYALQQPIVPNQTALVWRDDIGRVHMRLVQLEALFADRDAAPSSPAATPEVEREDMLRAMAACFGDPSTELNYHHKEWNAALDAILALFRTPPAPAGEEV